jgi:ATP/maltotriose-dependent transcriptional regulator MalT
MIRASSRSAVSHLHVVASEPAATPDDAPLIERAVELGRLAGAVRRLAEGEGGVVVLDAPAGLGKTALLERAALFATEAGCLVRRAAPGPLERHALEGDLLLREAGRRAAYHLCVRTLVMTDHAEEAAQAIAAMLDEATARGSLRLRAGAAWYASNLALRSGDVAEAENQARLALDLVDDDVNTFTGGAIMLLLYALAERGEFEEARELLRRHRLDGSLGPTRWEIGIRHARARLWLAEGDFERAHAEACAAGALREQEGRRNPSWTPWRSTAALALAHLGRREEAAASADALPDGR